MSIGDDHEQQTPTTIGNYPNSSLFSADGVLIPTYFPTPLIPTELQVSPRSRSTQATYTTASVVCAVRCPFTVLYYTSREVLFQEAGHAVYENVNGMVVGAPTPTPP